MARRPRRLIVSSDGHPFVGRIIDLSIAGMYFDSHEDVQKFPDAKYVLDVNERISLLTQRIGSLNHVGDLLWPKAAVKVEALPISAYEFCNFIHDVFLMRTISILDCCCLLAVEVLELGINPRETNVDGVRKFSKNHSCCEKLQAISDLQFELRAERNIRFHRGEERPFTDDDITFKTVALFRYRGSNIPDGLDRHGRKFNLKRSYNQAIDQMRDKFRTNLRNLGSSLDDFYSGLSDEFEKRFHSKFRAEGSFGRRHGVFAEANAPEL